MGNLLHLGKSQPAVSAQDRAVWNLKIQRDKLKQYQKRLQLILAREHDIAKHHLAQGDKKRALMALKKKRFQQTLIDKADAQLFNLEQLASSIEFALVESQVVAGLAEGTKVLEALNREMKIEDLDNLMQDTAEAIAYQKEIDEMLSGQLSQEDDDAVLAELDFIEKQELADSMPIVPNVVPQAVRTDDDKVKVTEKVAAKEKQKGINIIIYALTADTVCSFGARVCILEVSINNLQQLDACTSHQLAASFDRILFSLPTRLLLFIISYRASSSISDCTVTALLVCRSDLFFRVDSVLTFGSSS
jgi:charged multivesicular body protein 6